MHADIKAMLCSFIVSQSICIIMSTDSWFPIAKLWFTDVYIAVYVSMHFYRYVCTEASHQVLLHKI